MNWQEYFGGKTQTVGAEPTKKERLHSWMRVFFTDVYQHSFLSLEQLNEFVSQNDYSCVGQSHSYNGVQVVAGSRAAMLGKSALKEITIDSATQTATCGPSVTVKELKTALMTKNLRMLNSGNYMAQTVIGAIAGGTHGFGERATVADGVVSLTFLDGQGEAVTLDRGHPDFPYAVLSFGTIGPIVSVTIEAIPVTSFQSDAWVTRLSKRKRLAKGSVATNWAAAPYSNVDDPLIMLHTLRVPVGAAKKDRASRPGLFSWAAVATFLIERLWAFDRAFPSSRRAVQRLADRVNVRTHRRTNTDPADIDFRYDPEPLLKTQRAPDILTGFFSTTYTAYNLAFHVPLEEAEEVVRFIMVKAEKWRTLGFYLKSFISVRELTDRSPHAFAGNFEGPTAAIDLFADVRDYAWLERMQRDVLSYYPRVRPHWGKSALVDEFRPVVAGAPAQGEPDHIERLRDLHQRHYPRGNLKPAEAVRKLFDLGTPSESTPLGLARTAVRPDGARPDGESAR